MTTTFDNCEPDCPRERRAWVFAVLDAEHGIGEGGEVTKVDAANRAVILVQAVGLTALQLGDADQLPAVGKATQQGRIRTQFGKLKEIVEDQNIGTVEVCGRVGIAQMVRVVAGEEKDRYRSVRRARG